MWVCCGAVAPLLRLYFRPCVCEYDEYVARLAPCVGVASLLPNIAKDVL